MFQFRLDYVCTVVMSCHPVHKKGNVIWKLEFLKSVSSLASALAAFRGSGCSVIITSLTVSLSVRGRGCSVIITSLTVSLSVRGRGCSVIITSLTVSLSVRGRGCSVIITSLTVSLSVRGRRVVSSSLSSLVSLSHSVLGGGVYCHHHIHYKSHCHSQQ